MKRIAVVLLSLFLIYGGVAWALATCLRQHDRPSEDHSIHFHGSVSSGSSQDPAGPVVHCPFPESQIGPAARGASTELSRWHRAAAVQGPFYHILASVTLNGSLWLDAVFRGILTFSYPDNFGRHLFLSVLRI
ncbi:MAG TPA: hypothetical protein VIH18_35145 [Candidatus Binatia bacterium]|jgi:hypothetical protein